MTDRFMLTTVFVRRSRLAGFTLIEVMVALTIGIILATIMSLIFVANGSYRSDLDRTSRSIENLSFAMQHVVGDLRLAGYYAEMDVANSGIGIPATKPDPCKTDLASLGQPGTTAGVPNEPVLQLAVQGYSVDASSTSTPTLPASCSTIVTDLKKGSDVLVVRRSDPCTIDPATGLSATVVACDAVAGTPYFQTSHCVPDGTNVTAGTELAGPVAGFPTGTNNGWFWLDTDLTKLTLHNIDCNVTPTPGKAVAHRFIVDIFFVTNNDQGTDGIPTLKQAQLGASGGVTAFTTSPIAEGVENMQLEYGLDSAGTDGIPDTYTADPDTFVNAGGCPGTPAACVTNWTQVVSVKVHLLGRNTEATPLGLNNDKSYTLGLKADGTANTIAAFNDKFKRHVYEGTVRLYNPGGRR